MHSRASPVLVVDDEPSFRFLMTSLLEHVGFRTVAAGSVDEALDVLVAEPFSLVVSDYALGRATGLDLLEAVRARNSELPFVLVSADLPVGVAELALGAGAQRVLRKAELVAELAGLAERLAA
jgi:CheY-like chemotaxis protein